MKLSRMFGNVEAWRGRTLWKRRRRLKAHSSFADWLPGLIFWIAYVHNQNMRLLECFWVHLAHLFAFLELILRPLICHVGGCLQGPHALLNRCIHPVNGLTNRLLNCTITDNILFLLLIVIVYSFSFDILIPTLRIIINNQYCGALKATPILSFCSLSQESPGATVHSSSTWPPPNGPPRVFYGSVSLAT